MTRLSEIDCRTAAERVWDFIDRQLGPGSMDEVADHLSVCAQCAPHFRFARQVVEAVAISHPPLEASRLAPLRTRIMAELAAAGYATIPEKSA